MLAKFSGSVGRGHDRLISGTTIWCDRCGAYGSDKAVELRHPCTGDPTERWTPTGLIKTKVGRRIDLTLLKSGRHPETRQSLPAAVPEASFNEAVVAHQGVSSTHASSTRRVAPRPDILARVRAREAEARIMCDASYAAPPQVKRRKLCSKTPAEASWYG